MAEQHLSLHTRYRFSAEATNGRHSLAWLLDPLAYV